MITSKQLLLWCLIWGSVSFTYGAPTTGIQNERGDLASDLENWMTKLPNYIRKLPVNFIAIPGSHDSFTSNISIKSEISPDGEALLKKLSSLKTVKALVANWSKTQAFNVLQQLQAGIRYFDLRFCRNNTNNNLYFCHAMFSSEVRSVLTDMAAYLESHPKEVVILDCQHFYNFTSETHTEVIKFLKDTFGDKLIPHQRSIDLLTLDSLAAQNKQVLVIYRNSSQKEHAVLWPKESFPTPWYNTMNTSYLINNLDTGLEKRSLGTGYISQLVLTPSIEDIIGDFLSTLREKCAVNFQNTRNQWISSQNTGQGIVNVIIADFVDLDDNIFSKTVINLNARLNAYDELHNIGIIKRVKRYLANFIALAFFSDRISSSE